MSADGVRTEEVRQFPPPTDVKTLRPFLVLASYYQRFVPGFSETSEPLYTKEVEFIWSAECQEVFDRGTGVVTYTEVCRLQVSFYSGDGRVREWIGCCPCTGTVRPIAHASWSLQKHEQNYGITELESLGVVWAVKHFRPYLYRVIQPADLRGSRRPMEGGLGPTLVMQKCIVSWWPGMRKDVTCWTHSCLVCATHSTGMRVKPPLMPRFFQELVGEANPARILDGSNRYIHPHYTTWAKRQGVCVYRFYTLIPHDFGLKKTPLLDTEEIIKMYISLHPSLHPQTKTQMVDSLLEIEVAYSLLLCWPRLSARTSLRGMRCCLCDVCLQS